MPVMERRISNTITTLYIRKNVFFNVLHDHFPEIRSLREMDRQTIQEILPQIHSLSTNRAIRAVTNVSSMFKYMYDHRWNEGPETDALFNCYDTLKKGETLPRPIPSNIVIQLDKYLVQVFI